MYWRQCLFDLFLQTFKKQQESKSANPIKWRTIKQLRNHSLFQVFGKESKEGRGDSFGVLT